MKRFRERVLLLTQFFPPESFAAANRVRAFADALATKYNVTVVTLKPSYPYPAFYSSSSIEQADSTLEYRIRRAFPFRRHAKGALARAFREQVMALRLARVALREPADVVITSSPSMFLGPVAWALAKVKRAFFVWDIRDITWQYVTEVVEPHDRARTALPLLTRTMWFVVHNADLVTAATTGIADDLCSKGLPARKVVLVPNAIASALWDSLSMSRETVAKPRPLVSYVGLIGHLQAVGVLLDVARELPEVDFLFAGDGPERERLERRARDSKLQNVTFTGYLAQEQLVEVYRASDVLFAQLRDTPTLNKTGMPSKLLEYMAAQRPIVYAGTGLAAEQVEAIGCGIAVSPEDPATIVSAVRELLKDPGRRESLARKGREFIAERVHSEHPATLLLTALSERISDSA